MIATRTLRFAFALTGILGLAGAAQADPQWDKDHPHHDNVVTHAPDQKARVTSDRDVKAVHQDDHAVRADDHAVHPDDHGMAARDRNHVVQQDHHSSDQQVDAIRHDLSK